MTSEFEGIDDEGLSEQLDELASRIIKGDEPAFEDLMSLPEMTNRQIMLALTGFNTCLDHFNQASTEENMKDRPPYERALVAGMAASIQLNQALYLLIAEMRLHAGHAAEHLHEIAEMLRGPDAEA